MVYCLLWYVVLLLSMKLKAVIVISLLCLISYSNFAQENSASHKIGVQLPEVALLGLVSENQGDISFGASAPNEAGSSVGFPDTGEKGVWINYSSVVSQAAPKRKVIAMIQGEVPNWIKLKVEASEYSGSGKGKLGKSTGVVTLSNQPTDVIVDIGSCYTGMGINNGHYLSYNLDRNISSENYATLSEMQTSVNVVYTLTDDN